MSQIKKDIRELCVLFVVVVAVGCLVIFGPVVFADEPAKPKPPRETEIVKQLATLWELDPERHTEVPTPDGSRIDLLTNTHAYEVDWAEKWAEGVGQSLYYGLVTERKPGLLLIIKDRDRDRKYYLRALSVCGKHGISLGVIQIKEGEIMARVTR